jgi:hypothetical protein
MRRPHIDDRRSRTSQARPPLFRPEPYRMQKTSRYEVIVRHPNNFADHNRKSSKPLKGFLSGEL